MAAGGRGIAHPGNAPALQPPHGTRSRGGSLRARPAQLWRRGRVGDFFPFRQTGGSSASGLRRLRLDTATPLRSVGAPLSLLPHSAPVWFPFCCTTNTLILTHLTLPDRPRPSPSSLSLERHPRPAKPTFFPSRRMSTCVRLALSALAASAVASATSRTTWEQEEKITNPYSECTAYDFPAVDGESPWRQGSERVGSGGGRGRASDILFPCDPGQSPPRRPIHSPADYF